MRLPPIGLSTGLDHPRLNSTWTSLPTLFIEGPAWWSPQMPGWEAACAAFRGEAALADPPSKRPATRLLAPAERRRVTDTIALALEVASASVQACGRCAATLPSVFTSAYGDISTDDYLCNVLATDPLALSPTKFHNSVHNAAAGYWTIAVGCTAASTSITADACSFGTGLLEAAIQCAADNQPVLLVAHEVAAVGPLTDVVPRRDMFAAAFVIAPGPTANAHASMDCSIAPGTAGPPCLKSAAANSVATLAMTESLALMEALALGRSTDISLPLSPNQVLSVSLVAKATAGSGCACREA